jgi:hypothetical protein
MGLELPSSITRHPSPASHRPASPSLSPPGVQTLDCFNTSTPCIVVSPGLCLLFRSHRLPTHSASAHLTTVKRALEAQAWILTGGHFVSPPKATLTALYCTPHRTTISAALAVRFPRDGTQWLRDELPQIKVSASCPPSIPGFRCSAIHYSFCTLRLNMNDIFCMTCLLHMAVLPLYARPRHSVPCWMAAQPPTCAVLVFAHGSSFAAPLCPPPLILALY